MSVSDFSRGSSRLAALAASAPKYALGRYLDQLCDELHASFYEDPFHHGCIASSFGLRSRAANDCDHLRERHCPHDAQQRHAAFRVINGAHQRRFGGQRQRQQPFDDSDKCDDDDLVQTSSCCSSSDSSSDADSSTCSSRRESSVTVVRSSSGSVVDGGDSGARAPSLASGQSTAGGDSSRTSTPPADEATHEVPVVSARRMTQGKSVARNHGPPLNLSDLPDVEDIRALPRYVQNSRLHTRAMDMGRDCYRDPNTGVVVFTRQFLLRGACCGEDCRHCPYGRVPGRCQTDSRRLHHKKHHSISSDASSSSLSSTSRSSSSSSTVED